MPAWQQDTDINAMFQLTSAPEDRSAQAAVVANRKVLKNALSVTTAPETAAASITTCSAEDRAYQAKIIKDTEKWRDEDWWFPYGGYWGLWLEEQFLKFWQKTQNGCPIGGRFYVPIYYYLAYRFLSKDELRLIGDYLATLDTDKKYFTILLLSKGMKILGYDPPADLDFLIFAAGGITKAEKTTNVPLTLLIKEQKMSETPLPKVIFASFAGTFETHPVRKKLYELYGDKWDFYAPQLDNEIENWWDLMEQSVFCLAPRGFGTSSFRMYEALQLGCIPVYIWEEEIMLPYTEFIDWNSFSIIIEVKNVDQLGQKLIEADVKKLQARVEKVRHMMTYNYTMHYIISYLESGSLGYPADSFKSVPAGVATF